MTRLTAMLVVLLLITGVGAAEGVSDVGSSHGEEVTEAVASTQHDEFDSEDKMQEGIEKDQVKRGMAIALVAKDTWDDLEMERGVKPGALELVGSSWQDGIASGSYDVRAGSADAARKEISVKTETENGKDVRIVKEKKLAGGGDDGEGLPDETEGAIFVWTTDEGEGGEYKLTAIIIDQLDDRKQVNVRAGEKEFNIAIPDDQAEKIGTVGEAIEYIEKNAEDVNYEEDDEDMLEARKARNPQTGKEIKIPAKGIQKDDPKIGAAMEGKVKFFNEEKGYASIKEKESGEEYFVHATGLIDEIRDEDDVTFEIREERKGLNAVDVRSTD